HLYAVSLRGEATISRTFEVASDHWASLDYWYYPDPTRTTPGSLGFTITDDPMKKVLFGTLLVPILLAACGTPATEPPAQPTGIVCVYKCEVSCP
ncbi:MAG: hypothetical protein JXA14_11745, partial [Anaerolineae bacterium]|nr:hypothetical protein [Anaerolineae bacterium]